MGRLLSFLTKYFKMSSVPPLSPEEELVRKMRNDYDNNALMVSDLPAEKYGFAIGFSDVTLPTADSEVRNRIPRPDEVDS